MARLAAAGGPALRTDPWPPWPQAGPEGRAALDRVLASGAWSSTQGTEVRAFEGSFADYQEARHGVCVSSGEAALRLALTALGIGRGDEVIVPAYTFIATATAVLQVGATPVFADVDPLTYNLAAAAAAALVGERTAALLPVHFAGLPAELGALGEVAGRNGLAIVEDAAQAWGARYRDRPVGAIGAAGCFSFHASKNLTAGEGGVILTDDDDVAARCRSLADCGRAAPTDRYAHVVLGGNYRMTEFQGALLRAQLARYPEQLALRRANAAALRRQLADIPGVEPLELPDHSRHAWHLVVVRVDRNEFDGLPKAKLIEALAREGVPAAAGYLSPPYAQPLFEDRQRVPSRRGDCPVAERACGDEAVWFRHQVLLGAEDDALDVARALDKVRRHADELR